MATRTVHRRYEGGPDDIVVLRIDERNGKRASLLAEAIEKKWSSVEIAVEALGDAWSVIITNLDWSKTKDRELAKRIRDWASVRELGEHWGGSPARKRKNPTPTEEDEVDEELGVDNPQRWSKSEVQSLLFDTDEYTAQEAKEWAREHDYLHGKVDTTGRYHRLRQEAPMGGPCRTVEFGKGIRAIVCSSGRGRPPGVPNRGCG